MEDDILNRQYNSVKWYWFCGHWSKISPGISKQKVLLLHKYFKNIFAKGYTPKWSEEVFVISKIKDTVPWTNVINNLIGEEIIGTFYEKELQKTNQKEFIIEKVIKKEGDKLYVKWKVYDNSFNIWIDKKDLV